ncbi:hypothetical protein KIM372_11960 [Bombiscardovia nodaiensis]|uniref:RNA helicase HrpA C-terminal domain-containing protein n=1 Tax=Bombiscardovia nodaiensis TaxID=2932181 RepID=A0ABM8B8S7_9BIFI|nr:hypothetical protein KIM372_11960 [Bombiscardovia nodaiensis]
MPGLLDELIVATIKSLPKALRVQFVPAPDTAAAIRAWIDERYPLLPGADQASQLPAPEARADTQASGGPWPPFDQVFTKAAVEVVGAQVHPQVFSPEQEERLPAYLRMTFAVEEPVKPDRSQQASKSKGRQHKHRQQDQQQGNQQPTGSAPRTKPLGQSKSLGDLQRRFAEQARKSAQARVSSKAQQAKQEGQIVKQANLLQRSGATTIPRSQLLWQGALETLRLPAERVSSRWLSREALMLASAPYASTKALVEDLQMAAVKRLLPRVADLPDDQALKEAVYKVSGVYEDTVYQVAQDVIRILKRYAEVDKAVSGPADLPLLSVLQWVREHIATLVYTSFIANTAPEALPRLETYLNADLERLQKARKDKDRDVRWAWQANEAQELVSKARTRASQQPAGPRREALLERADQARWMLEEFYISLWAQELGTKGPVSLQRIRKLLEEES